MRGALAASEQGQAELALLSAEVQRLRHDLASAPPSARVAMEP